MNKGEIKKFLKKFWFVVWKDDSFKGWIMSIIFLFVVIKFLFFPALNFLTGTQLPLAIVESCSMYHDGNLFSNFDEWYQKHEEKYSSFGINELLFHDFILRKGFNKGDILFIVGAKPEKLEVGDVIIFLAGLQHPVIHRIVDIREEEGKYYFSTMGDNVGRVQVFEENISEDQLIGKAVFKVAPYLGWAKLIFFEPFQNSYNKGLCREN